MKASDCALKKARVRVEQAFGMLKNCAATQLHVACQLMSTA